MGDALLQKTYITDCITKKVKKNMGERPMYYVENNHPAIVSRETFDQVQKEMSAAKSRRSFMWRPLMKLNSELRIFLARSSTGEN